MNVFIPRAQEESQLKNKITFPPTFRNGIRTFKLFTTWQAYPGPNYGKRAPKSMQHLRFRCSLEQKIGEDCTRIQGLRAGTTPTGPDMLELPGMTPRSQNPPNHNEVLAAGNSHSYPIDVNGSSPPVDWIPWGHARTSSGVLESGTTLDHDLTSWPFRNQIIHAWLNFPTLKMLGMCRKQKHPFQKPRRVRRISSTSPFFRWGWKLSRIRLCTELWTESVFYGPVFRWLRWWLRFAKAK